MQLTEWAKAIDNIFFFVYNVAQANRIICPQSMHVYNKQRHFFFIFFAYRQSFILEQITFFFTYHIMILCYDPCGGAAGVSPPIPPL